jgi:tetratricopeptide (TPR) repeat protein
LPPSAPQPAPRPASHLHVDLTKLRQLAYLPIGSLAFRWDNDDLRPEPRPPSKEVLAEQIAELEQALEGDESDAERYAELGRLYEIARRPEEVRAAAWANARELFRQRILTDPTDGGLHGQYAMASWPHVEEMEPAALEAVRWSPEDWRCWTVLGLVRYQQMIVALTGSEWSAGRRMASSWVDQFQELSGNASEDRIDSIQNNLQEATRCFDKAVSLAPDEFDTHLFRHECQLLLVCVSDVVRTARHQPRPHNAREPEVATAVEDAVAMVRLRPNDPDVLSCLAWTYVISACAQGSESPPADAGAGNACNWDSLPSATKKDIAAVTRKLCKLTHNQESDVAARACQRAVFWLSGMNRYDLAEKYAARATVLQPDCEYNWDLLAAMNFGGEKGDDWDRAYEVCKRKWGLFPTPKNYLVLAHHCASLHRLEEAEDLLREAVKRFPDDLSCKLGLAAVLLLQNDRPAALAEARDLLDAVAEPIQKSGDQALAFEWAFHQAIVTVLGEQRDQGLGLLLSAPWYPDGRKWVERACALFSLQGS